MLTSHVDKATLHNHNHEPADASSEGSPFFSRARTKAVRRIGPHNKDVLDVAICGMLGDWSAEKIKGQISPSVRFSIDQAICNTAYIHHLALYFYAQGYCSSIVPILLKKPGTHYPAQHKFNYRLSLFAHVSFGWIYDSFYQDVEGVRRKVIPS